VEDVQDQLTKELYGDDNATEDTTEQLDTTTDASVENGASENEGGDVSSTFSLGDKQYTREELETLVKLGEIGRDAEERYNTKLDRVWPEYSRISNENKELLEKVKNYEATKQDTPQFPESEEQAIREAKEAAKRLGILTKEDIEDLGLVSKQALEQEFRNLLNKEKITDTLVNTADTLEREIDGNDGRPKFDKQGVLQYMVDNGINVDPSASSSEYRKKMETAYKLMNEERLDAWKEEQLTKGKKPGLITQSASNTGNKQPVKTKPTRDNLAELVAQELYGGSE
jgi:hypothetical protein